MNTKKLLLNAAVLATMLTSISCSQEEVAGGQAGDESVVTFTAQLPGSPQSKAIGDGMTATTLSYAVYAQGTTTPLITSEDEVTFTNGQATISLRLASGRSYDLLFWADAYGAEDSDAPYTVDFDTQTLTIDYDAAKTLSNDENRDAFFGTTTIEVKGAVSGEVTLKRPFAQLNIGTDDMKDAANTGLNTSALRTSVTVKNVYKNLNLMNGEVGEDATVTFGENDIPEGQFTANGNTYDYLALNYLLVGTDKGVVDCEFTYTDGATNGSKTISNVPVQRNYRTNIFGSILTGAVDLEITIDPDFETTEHNYEELLLAAQNGGSVTLTEDVTITEALTIANGVTVTIDLNSHDIINNTSIPDDTRPDLGNTTVFQVGDGATLNIRGEGKVHAISNVENEDGYRMAVYALGNSVVNIYGGNFYNNQNYDNGNAQLDLIYADQNAVINIYGGTFESACANSSGYWVLNLNDNSNAAINVYGGTFVNFDPSSSTTENPVKNFVASGYSSVKVSDDPTPNGTYEVVKGNGAASSEDITSAIQSGAELITLVKDVTVGSMGAFNTANTVTIDLNGQTVTMSNRFNGNISQGGEVTFCNGALKSNGNIIISNGKLSLDNVTLDGFEHALNCQGEDAYLEITNSTLKGEYFVLSTNANVEDGTLTWGKDARIILKDSNFEATETAFMNNVPATIEIDGCTFKGNHQGGLLRGGTYIIRNSTFTLNAELPGDHWENHPNDNWEDGNRAVFAGLTIGNRSASSYQYPTNVTLENVTVNVEGTYASEHPAVYVYANQGEGLGVTLNHSGCTFNGDVIYGSANITVNGEPATVTEP